MAGCRRSLLLMSRSLVTIDRDARSLIARCQPDCGGTAKSCQPVPTRHLGAPVRICGWLGAATVRAHVAGIGHSELELPRHLRQDAPFA